jgi:hypothetical protein
MKQTGTWRLVNCCEVRSQEDVWDETGRFSAEDPQGTEAQEDLYKESEYTSSSLLQLRCSTLNGLQFVQKATKQGDIARHLTRTFWVMDP